MLAITTCPLSERYDRVIDDLCDLSETHFYKGQIDVALCVLQAGETLINNPGISDSAQAKLSLQLIHILMQDDFLRGTPTMDRKVR